jgi:hypothetical protein
MRRGPSLEQAFVIAGIAAEIAFLALLTHKRFFRHMPFFYGYVCFGILNDLAMLLIQHRYPSQFLPAYVVQFCVDSALQYGVLVELAWCVLRPARATLPRGTLVGLSLLILAAGAICWPFCGRKLPAPWHLLTAAQETTSILRILFFLVLVAGSHLLALGWRDRELQVATGLGGYSLMSFAALIIHSHQKTGMSYHWVDIIVSLSYVASLVYWIVSFVQAEAPRREFTPQMRGVLMAVAAAAHSRGARLPAMPPSPGRRD